METAIRHLRDGRQGRPQAPLHLLIQQADSLGGAAMLSAMLAAILDSVSQGRVDAAAALALTFVETECTLRRRHPATAQAQLHVAPYAACDSFHRFAQQALLQTAAPAAVTPQSCSTPGGQVYVVIDCLSTAFMYHAPGDILQALRALQASPRVAGILTLIVPELQPQAHVDTVRALATCETLLRPVTHSQATVLLAATGRHVHLEAVTSSLRHSGRIKIDSALYEMLDTGLLRQHRAPADTVVTAQQLAAADLAELKASTSAPPAGDDLQAKYEKDMSGFMKLSLSRKEKEARDKVVLPYEHAGQGGAHGDRDFARYLPPDAGGSGRGGGPDGRGHILYVRDSDNDCDSDEDPDDDLDI